MIMKFKNVYTGYINEWLKKNKKSSLITNILTMFASQSSDWHLEYQKCPMTMMSRQWNTHRVGQP